MPLRLFASRDQSSIERERTIYTQARADSLDNELLFLETCIVAAAKWGDLTQRLAGHKEGSITEVVVGTSFNEKLSQGSTPQELAQKIGGTDGWLSREEFVKSFVLMKNTGELRIEGSSRELKNRFEATFDMLQGTAQAEKAKQAHTVAPGSQQDAKLNVRLAIDHLQKLAVSHEEEETWLRGEEASLMEAAKALQVKYAEMAAVSEQTYELYTAREKQAAKGSKLPQFPESR